jgi:dihydrolipoamide dehydrogenase
MKNTHHLASLGITVGEVSFDRQGIADHASNLATKVKGNLEGSLVGLGVTIVEGRGALTGTPHQVLDQATGKVYTAKVCGWLQLVLSHSW